MQMYVIPEDALVSLIDRVKDAPMGCNMSGRQQDIYLNQIRSSVTPIPANLDVIAMIDKMDVDPTAGKASVSPIVETP